MKIAFKQKTLPNKLGFSGKAKSFISFNKVNNPESSSLDKKNKSKRIFAEKVVKKGLIYRILLTILIISVGVFFYFYVKTCGGFIQRFRRPVLVCGYLIITIIGVIGVTLSFTDKTTVNRLILSALTLCVFILAALHFLKVFGFWENFTSIDALRVYLSEKGVYAAFITFVLQFLQVVVLPLPSILTTSAAVMLFGVFKGALISFGGIFLGSITAFFVSRKLGVKVVSFILGKEKSYKLKQSFKGVDTVFLTTMFLLPFFPDDLLCFAAGLSSISDKRFIITIAFTRLISCFITSLSVGGKLVPYNTPQGVSVWIIILLVSATVSLTIYKKMTKKGEK